MPKGKGNGNRYWTPPVDRSPYRPKRGGNSRGRASEYWAEVERQAQESQQSGQGPLCEACQGTKKCETCKGEGQLTGHDSAIGDYHHQCLACKGTGVCRVCQGTSTQPPTL